MTNPVLYLSGLLTLANLYDAKETQIETLVSKGIAFDEDDSDARLYALAESFRDTIGILWGDTSRMTLRIVEIRLLELADRTTSPYHHRSLMNAWCVLVYHI